MLQGIKLIIYDLDGVLIDSNPAIKTSIENSLKELGLDYEIDKIMELMGTPLDKIYEKIFNEEDQEKIPEAVEKYRAYYLEKGKTEIEIQEKVFETLKYFKENGLKQSIASNSSRELMKPIMSELGIMEYIDLFVGVEDVENPKPHPCILRITMEQLGISENATIFVDDSATGLGAGKKAGVHTAGITTGVHTVKQIISVNPDFILNQLDDLKKIIFVD